MPTKLLHFFKRIPISTTSLFAVNLAAAYCSRPSQYKKSGCNIATRFMNPWLLYVCSKKGENEMYYGEVTWFGIIVFFIIVAIERRRKRKAEEERKKEVDRLFKEESERVSEILKKFPDRKT